MTAYPRDLAFMDSSSTDLCFFSFNAELGLHVVGSHHGANVRFGMERMLSTPYDINAMLASRFHAAQQSVDVKVTIGSFVEE